MRAQGDAMIDRQHGENDIAFLSQPSCPSANAMRRRIGRGCEILRDAERVQERADNLAAMASRNAGDAAKRDQAKRDALQIEVGDTVTSFLLRAPSIVTKVNAKTIRVRGWPEAIDKTLVKVVRS